MHVSGSNGALQPDGNDRELARRLFVQAERIGWEYRVPAPMAPHPLAAQPPRQVEPTPPDLDRWRRLRNKALKRSPVALGVTCLVGLGVAWLSEPWGWAILFAGAGLTSAAVGLPIWRIRQDKRQHVEARAAAKVTFERDLADWHRQLEEHEAKEKARVDAALLWHPLRWTEPSRIDVFGGTVDGWASLLTTLGGSLLGKGNVLVLDFSEEGLADGLAGYADTASVGVTEMELPAQAAAANLIGGLSGEQVAELVAEMVHTLRTTGGSGPDGSDLRVLDAELVGVVANRTAEPLTFDRLTAGLRVLRRQYDITTETMLTADEYRALNDYVDQVGTTDRVADELQYLTSLLSLLTTNAAEGDAQPDTAPLTSGRVWPVRGLSVVATSSTHQRRKDLWDRLAFHRLLHDLRAETAAGERHVIVAAGVDHLGLPALETLSRLARRAGVRLVLLIGHLRGDLTQLLGGSDSAAIVMRLGNAAEAAAAAEFIGRGHKFVLSQVTEQTGETFTDQTSTAVGGQESTATTTGRTSTRSVGRSSSRGSTYSQGGQSDSTTHGSNRGRSWSRSSSKTVSRARTWQDTASQSKATSEGSSETVSRVHEYQVEPTTIQSLAPTALLLVHPGPNGRRVFVGDCNPGISLLDRVADQPFDGQPFDGQTYDGQTYDEQPLTS